MLYINQRYDATIKLLREQMDLMTDEAQTIVDEYWAFMKLGNQKLARDHAAGVENGNYFATLAPVIEDKNRGNRKPHIRWKLFNAEGRKITQAVRSKAGREKRSSSIIIAKALKPTARGYTSEQLSRYCAGWEKEMVIAAEEQLDVIRRFINNTQDCIVALERVQRSRLKEFQNQE